MLHMTEESAQDRALQHELDTGLSLPIPRTTQNMRKKKSIHPGESLGETAAK